MQPFSVIVSARTKAQAAIGSTRYPPATIAVIATTAIPARRALRIDPPSVSVHQLISHVLLRAFDCWSSGILGWGSESPGEGVGLG
jgi:hypothetical protein